MQRFVNCGALFDSSVLNICTAIQYLIHNSLSKELMLTKTCTLRTQGKILKGVGRVVCGAVEREDPGWIPARDGRFLSTESTCSDS